MADTTTLTLSVPEPAVRHLPDDLQTYEDVDVVVDMKGWAYLHYPDFRLRDVELVGPSLGERRIPYSGHIEGGVDWDPVCFLAAPPLFVHHELPSDGDGNPVILVDHLIDEAQFMEVRHKVMIFIRARDAWSSYDPRTWTRNHTYA